MERGDIYSVSLEPSFGHEQQGHRPVLIISAITNRNAFGEEAQEIRGLLLHMFSNCTYKVGGGAWRSKGGGGLLSREEIRGPLLHMFSVCVLVPSREGDWGEGGC